MTDPRTPPPLTPAAMPPGGRAARLIVVLCVAITTVATALIYWRWVTVTEPSSYIIVQGAEEHNGTVVTISPENSNEVVAMTTLTPQNQYAVTIFLHPGTYTLTATHNGETLIHGDILVLHRRWKVIQLRPKTAPNRSAARDQTTRAGVS